MRNFQTYWSVNRCPSDNGVFTLDILIDTYRSRR